MRRVIFDVCGPAGFLMLLCDWSQPIVDWPIYDPKYSELRSDVKADRLTMRGDMEQAKEVNGCSVKVDEKKSEKALVCSMCGKPATQSVDGEPSCAAHIGQIYEHQVEDYTSKHLHDNEWRQV